MMNKIKILVLILFISCSILQAMLISDIQKFSQVKDQKVKSFFDCWKYYFGLKTLGGGYVRYILLITDENIVEVEMPEVSHTPGYSGGLFSVNEPIELFLNVVLFPLEEILPDQYEKMRQEILRISDSLKQDPTVENFVNSISYLYSEGNEKIEVKNIYPRNFIQDLKLKRKGNEVILSFKVENKKQTYISRYKETEKVNKVFLALQDVFGVENRIKKEVSTVDVPKDYSRIENQKEKDYAQGAWYIEILGNTIIGSANIDYRFHPNFSFRIGASYMIFGFGFPVMLNFLSGYETSHHLEFGAGIVPFVGGFGSTELVFFETLTLGYRYQPKNGGLVFRISFTPLVNFPEPGKILPWGGISIGYAFK